MEGNVAALRSRQHDRSVEQPVHEIGEHGNAHLHASRAHIVPHLAQEMIIPNQVQQQTGPPSGAGDLKVTQGGWLLS